MNIGNQSAIRNCTSCQICGAVCPTGAIDINLNHQGFYRPVVDETKCINCGLCVKYCYKFDNDIKESILSSKSVIAAFAKDDTLLKKSTSGGIAEILAKYLIADGYKCIGVIYDNDKDCAVDHVASDKDEVEDFRGSKYIQSYSVEAFKDLVANCKIDKYAVFGLPCQIYAVDRYLRHRRIRDNHILIDLYCHGCPSLNLWTKYLNGVKSKIGLLKTTEVNFRSKIRGWGNYSLVIKGTDKDGVLKEYVSQIVNDQFYELFFSDLVLNDSCTDCKVRSTFEYTDLRLGDFWGKAYIFNTKGISGVTISSERGRKLIDKIKDSIIYFHQSLDNFLPYQSYGLEYDINKKLREEVFECLSDSNKSLDKCVKLYHDDLSKLSKIKRIIKNLIRCLPQNVIVNIKYVYYKMTMTLH